MADKNLFIIVTKDNKTLDLTKGREMRSNNLYPFGQHNYAIYESPEGIFVKGTNSGILSHMLDTYETITETEALAYKHPFVRLED